MVGKLLDALGDERSDGKFTGSDWQTSRPEVATVLGLADKMASIAKDARHSGPKTLAVNMAELKRLHPKLADSYKRLRAVIESPANEALANADGEVHELMAADDAVTLLGVLPDQLITRDGVQQVMDNLAELKTAILTLDRAV
ncbi:MAG: hypothetical protein KI792_01765 [Alphaproteobacteria bacterium]|nr:hypothetical protein [Alphaproteobacteria bacterium SS10]